MIKINGLKVKELREKNKMTLDRLTYMTDINESMLEDIESRKEVRIKPILLNRIAKVFSIPFSDYKKVFGIDNIFDVYFESIKNYRRHTINRTQQMANVGMGLYLSNLRVNLGYSRQQVISMAEYLSPIDYCFAYSENINIHEKLIADWESNLRVPNKACIDLLSVILGADKTLLTQLAKQMEGYIKKCVDHPFLSDRDSHGMKVAKILKEARKNKKLSKNDVVNLAHKKGSRITRDRILGIEKGTSRVGNKTIKMLCTIYDISYDDVKIKKPVKNADTLINMLKDVL